MPPPPDGNLEAWARRNYGDDFMAWATREHVPLDIVYGLARNFGTVLLNGDGFGGPGFAIRSEFTRIPYQTGTIGMASAGKDTEVIEYFITHAMQPHLDGKYTAFGKVVTGQDVVDRIYSHDLVRSARVLRP